MQQKFGFESLPHRHILKPSPGGFLFKRYPKITEL